MLVLMLSLWLLDDAPSFREGERLWRQEREARLRSETSWFNLAGFFWLKEGDNTFGTADDMSIKLPKHSTVPFAGTLTIQDGKVTYRMERAQRAVVDGETRNEGEIQPEQVIAHNNLRFYVIERGGKLALRVRDLRSKAVSGFKGLNFYKPRKQWLVEAKLELFDEPRAVNLSTIIDTEIEFFAPGKLVFTIDDQEMTLLPLVSGPDDDEYFILFKDETSGSETYGAGRYMYVPVAGEDGLVTINFNRAYNPPCAYTPYATCPLPPLENRLPIAITAGERDYHPDELLDTE